MPRPRSFLAYASSNMIRASIAAALVVLTLVASSVLSGTTPISSHGDEGGETVRIIARLQDDGDIEFGLRTSEGNQLPRLRVFSASITDENWRRSSPIEVPDGTEVRIIARRDGDTRVEFGLRIDEPRREFLPPRRFFPRSSTVGRWRSSTPILLPAPEAEVDQQSSQPETPTDEPDEPSTPSEGEGDESETGESTEASDVERISGGHRDGLAVVDGVLGDPDTPILISEYGDPF